MPFEFEFVSDDPLHPAYYYRLIIIYILLVQYIYTIQYSILCYIIQYIYCILYILFIIIYIIVNCSSCIYSSYCYCYSYSYIYFRALFRQPGILCNQDALPPFIFLLSCALRRSGRVICGYTTVLHVYTRIYTERTVY